MPRPHPGGGQFNNMLKWRIQTRFMRWIVACIHIFETDLGFLSDLFGPNFSFLDQSIRLGAHPRHLQRGRARQDKATKNEEKSRDVTSGAFWRGKALDSPPHLLPKLKELLLACCPQPHAKKTPLSTCPVAVNAVGSCLLLKLEPPEPRAGELSPLASPPGTCTC